MEQPEYEGKSFGVISLLGDEQYQLIQKEIDASISPKEIMQRNILCGNSANFQGDERDVIFLSLVDSKDIDNPGPLHLQNYGVDDSTRKRYNVAVSRARDQLWVVHSLDAANDLKPGDIRKSCWTMLQIPTRWKLPMRKSPLLLSLLLKSGCHSPV